MADIEKVIKGLEACRKTDCINCPYSALETEVCLIKYLLIDALELLKEQEAVEPNVTSAEQRCGNCNKVIEMDGWKSCPWCGKPIAWSEWWNKNGERSVK